MNFWRTERTAKIENETRQIISVNDNSWGFDGCLFTIENGELIDYELFDNKDID